MLRVRSGRLSLLQEFLLDTFSVYKFLLESFFSHSLRDEPFSLLEAIKVFQALILNVLLDLNLVEVNHSLGKQVFWYGDLIRIYGILS